MPTIADKVQIVYSNLENTNNQFIESISLLNKVKAKLDEGNIQFDKLENRGISDELLKEKLKLKQTDAELLSLRASEKLLLDSIMENDKQIMSLNEQKSKHINTINTMNTTIQLSQNKIDAVNHMELKLQDLCA